MTSLLARRCEVLGRRSPLLYDKPVCLVRGEGVWVFDDTGRRYLDAYNNVPHVGHCHPRVVEALSRQAGTLNTHTRYLHEGVVSYAERLLQTFDTSLSRVMFTCIGSEANELALRIVPECSGGVGVIGNHDDESLASEFDWMRALDRAGISVPRAIPSLRGADFEVIQLERPVDRFQVDLLEWIDGKQLGIVGESFAQGSSTIAGAYESIGATLAWIHNHGEQWTLPRGFRRHSWDAEGLVGEKPFWGPFWDLGDLTPSQRALMQRSRIWLKEGLAAFGMMPDRYGLIHADLIPENILVSGPIRRVINFDDAGFGWHLFDIATSLYFLIEEPIFKEARDALVRGYRRERALSNQQLSQLPLFLVARGTTYLGWIQSRNGTPAAKELTPFLVHLACTMATRAGH